MKKQLQELLNKYIKSEGICISSSIRDAMTDLFHIANENGLDVDNIIDGAKEVLAVEKID